MRCWRALLAHSPGAAILVKASHVRDPRRPIQRHKRIGYLAFGIGEPLFRGRREARRGHRRVLHLRATRGCAVNGRAAVKPTAVQPGARKVVMASACPCRLELAAAHACPRCAYRGRPLKRNRQRSRHLLPCDTVRPEVACHAIKWRQTGRRYKSVSISVRVWTEAVRHAG